MSSLQLNDLLNIISQWASESCTWVGNYQSQRITLSPIHPIKQIADLSLRLGSVEIKTPLISSDFDFQMGDCECCFELRTHEHTWMRFISCSSHNLKNRKSIKHLFAHCPASIEELKISQELVFYKNTRPIDAHSLAKHSHISKWHMFHVTGLHTISVPPHLEI